MTMTTVGYGDKAPQTFGGRLLALFWMFATLIIISSLTAAITSVVTVSQLEQKINSLDDLYNARVATVAGTNSAEVLSQLNIEFEKTETVEEALMLLKKNKVEAVVYDAPILQYLIKIKFKNYIQLLPTTFGRQDYGFGMPEGSLLREDINRLILKKTQSPEWEKKLDKYLK